MRQWTLEKLQRRDGVAECLVSAGLLPEQIEQKQNLFAQSAGALIAGGLPANAEAIAQFVPGRIEVLGKHTDYAGGHSLTAAVEQGFCAVAVARNDSLVSVMTAKDRQSVQFQFEPTLTPRVGHWSNYPMTVARRIARNFQGELRGANIAFASDLPPAAGMSSSSALMAVTFLLLSHTNDLANRSEYRHNIDSNLDLAAYLATVENGLSFCELTGDRGVGTLGGSEDPTAILCSQVGRLGQYSYCPTRIDRSLAMPSGYLFAIASSGVVAKKTGEAMEKYNRASRLASVAAAVWRDATGRSDAHLSEAIASSAAGGDCLRKALEESQSSEFESAELVERFEHFLAESEEIIPSVPARLEATGLARFGELVDRSQSLAEKLLHNQVAETMYLARTARDLSASAATAFGAGFGGSVWAIVEKTEASAFLASWEALYRTKFPEATQRATFFTTLAGCPAMEI